MVRFCKCGSDKFICQECANDLCSKGCDNPDPLSKASEWIEGKGNVCAKCLRSFYVMKNGKWVKYQPVKNYPSLKGNPAYDLMM